MFLALEPAPLGKFCHSGTIESREADRVGADGRYLSPSDVRALLSDLSWACFLLLRCIGFLLFRRPGPLLTPWVLTPPPRPGPVPRAVQPRMTPAPALTGDLFTLLLGIRWSMRREVVLLAGEVGASHVTGVEGGELGASLSTGKPEVGGKKK